VSLLASYYLMVYLMVYLNSLVVMNFLKDYLLVLFDYYLVFVDDGEGNSTSTKVLRMFAKPN
jgi:hypothetical protein